MRIASLPDDGWPVDVQGTASVQLLESGALITLDSVTIRARFAQGEPLYIAALRMNGTDVTGGGKRTSLMFSERLPVGQWLQPAGVITVNSQSPIFMKQPSWHQTDARFDLDVEIRVDGGDGWIPVSTNLHELGLRSDFKRRTVADIRETQGARVSWGYGLMLVTAMVAVWAYMRRGGGHGKGQWIALVLAPLVWVGGVYPVLRWAYALSWP